MCARAVIVAALAVSGAAVRSAARRSKGHGPEDYEWARAPVRRVSENRAKDLHATDKKGNAVTPLFFQINNEEDSNEILMFSRPEARPGRVAVWWVRSGPERAGLDLGYQYKPGYFMRKALKPMVSLFQEGKTVGGFMFGIEEVARRGGGTAPRAFVEAVAAGGSGGALAERGDLDGADGCPPDCTCCVSSAGPRSACVREAACADYWTEEDKADLGTWIAHSDRAASRRVCSKARDGLFAWRGRFENALDTRPSAREVEKVRAWLTTSGVAWAAPPHCGGSPESFAACAKRTAEPSGMLMQAASGLTASPASAEASEALRKGQDRMYILLFWVEDSSAWPSCAVGGFVYQRDPQSDEFWRREYKACSETFEIGGQEVKLRAGEGPLPPREIKALREVKL